MPRIFAGFFCHLFLSMHLENCETVYRQNNKNNDTLSGLERPIMSQEIELKLTISDDSIDAFLSSNVLSNYTPDVFMLENTYFDTSSQMLTKMGAALRLRKTPDEMVQTLKLRGRNVGGLHQREEWELPVSGDELEPDLFPEGALPKEIDLSELKPLFTTHFERTRWLVSYRQSTIELVLDRGQVRAGNEVDDILELELELKHGEVEDIFGLAIEISKEVAVMPSDISKAERGYRLCNRSQDASVALPVIVPQQSMESAFSALLGYEIEQ